MKINQRTKDGWEQRQNNGGEVCDLCQSKLWIAPHGGLYCNNIHPISKEALEAMYRFPLNDKQFFFAESELLKIKNQT